MTSALSVTPFSGYRETLQHERLRRHRTASALEERAGSDDITKINRGTAVQSSKTQGTILSHQDALLYRSRLAELQNLRSSLIEDFLASETLALADDLLLQMKAADRQLEQLEKVLSLDPADCRGEQADLLIAEIKSFRESSPL